MRQDIRKKVRPLPMEFLNSIEVQSWRALKGHLPWISGEVHFDIRWPLKKKSEEGASRHRLESMLGKYTLFDDLNKNMNILQITILCDA